MYVNDFIWLPEIVKKIEEKHNLSQEEVEEIFFNQPHFRFMENNVQEHLTSISGANSLEEIAEFWDTHSLADYWEQTHEVEIEVRARRRRCITLDPDLFQQIEEQAQRRGILPETLANLWLAERLQQVH